MSERIRTIIGDQLYNQIVSAGLEADKFDLLEGYIPRQRFNDVSAKNKIYESKIQAYETQLTDAKSILNTNEDLKNRYADLESKFQIELQKKDTEIANIYKKSLIEKELINSGARYPDLLINMIDLDKVTISDEKLIGFNEKITDMKSNYKDLFVETVNRQDTPTSGSFSGIDQSDDWSFMDNL